jgi:hypothetical protein
MPTGRFFSGNGPSAVCRSAWIDRLNEEMRVLPSRRSAIHHGYPLDKNAHAPHSFNPRERDA